MKHECSNSFMFSSMLWIMLSIHSMFTYSLRVRIHIFAHLLSPPSNLSNVPTSSGTSSSSSSPAASAFPPSMFTSWSFRNLYYCGPTCLRISGIISLSSLVSGYPATTKRFSLTENWAIKINLVIIWKIIECLLYGLLRWITVLSSLNILTSSMSYNDYIPNFLMVDLSFLSSWLTSVLWTTFLFLLWVPKIKNDKILSSEIEQYFKNCTFYMRYKYISLLKRLVQAWEQWKWGDLRIEFELKACYSLDLPFPPI